MSDMERNKGKLKPVSLEVIDAEFPDIDFYDLEFHTNGKYVQISKGFYEVNWEIRADCDVPEFADIEKHADGSVSFHTYHYNGGASWTEVIEDVLSSTETI